MNLMQEVSAVPLYLFVWGIAAWFLPYVPRTPSRWPFWISKRHVIALRKRDQALGLTFRHTWWVFEVFIMMHYNYGEVRRSPLKLKGVSSRVVLALEAWMGP